MFMNIRDLIYDKYGNLREVLYIISTLNHLLANIKINNVKIDQLLNMNLIGYMEDNKRVDGLYYTNKEELRLAIIATILEIKFGYNKSKWYSNISLEEPWFIRKSGSGKPYLFLYQDFQSCYSHNVFLSKKDLEVI